MRRTLDDISPIAKQLDKLNEQLDRPKKETEGLAILLKQADVLVDKCTNIEWKIWKRSRHASKLDNMNKSLRDFVQLNIILQNSVTVAETSVEVRKLTRRGSLRGLSCATPLQKEGVVFGFDDRVNDLKAMVLKNGPDDDCSIVVVSAAGGSGKTTFITLFCNDSEIQERFGGNIYFVTVSQSYNPKVIITKLLGELPSNTNNEDAIRQWGSFLGKNKSEVLLVLDDIWSDTVIKDFRFKLPRYKILATSRMNLRKFKTYHLRALNDQYATQLFRSLAMPELSNIPDDFVDKLVKCGKNHPLVLSVIGGLLNGTHLAWWESMFKELSEGNKSLFDLDNESILESLKKSFFLFDKEPQMKQCYMDMGLFPEDQKIAATELMDIWAHLYGHDDEGRATMKILDWLSSRNLATLLPKRKHSHAIINHCDEEFVMQHDMMRELAIHLSSKELPGHRERLILNSNGQALPQSPQILPQSPHMVIAHILSVSIDENFSLTWDEIQAPNVEVLVLNFMSEIHPLPRIIQTMEKLKVLIITNYGYNFSEIQNFPAPHYLSGLKKIRLDHISVSSIGTTILMLENLQKLSLIMCKIGNGFNVNIPNKLASLLEIDIESCDDLVTFPVALCDSVNVRKLSITNCHELTSLPKEVEKFSNLEVLRVASCTELTKLPESVTNLKILKTIDISQCISIRELPQNIGELGSLKTINATGCTGLRDELPESVHNLDKLVVVCDEETSHLWRHFNNVEVKVVEEDPLDTFFKIK